MFIFLELFSVVVGKSCRISMSGLYCYLFSALILLLLLLFFFFLLKEIKKEPMGWLIKLPKPSKLITVGVMHIHKHQDETMLGPRLTICC